MKNFFNNMKRSISDSSFYREIVSGEHPLKVRYAFGLALIGSIIVTSIFTHTLYTVLIPNLSTAISQNIPNDLVVTLKSGELFINQPVPYTIPLSDEDATEDYENLLVINTEVPASLEILSTYKTILFANKTTFITQKETGEIEVFPLKNFPDFALTRAGVLEVFASASQYAWIFALVVFIPIVIFQFISMMIIFLLAGFILWIIQKLASRPLLFKKAFTVSMYAYTIIFVVGILLSALHIWTFGLFSSSVLTALVAFLFLATKAPNPPAIPTQTNTTL